MRTKSYAAQTFWNLNKPLLPRRRQLFSLQPIGIGTLHVESLTGYIARLAQYHSLTTEELLVYEVLPLMYHRGFQVDCQTLEQCFDSWRVLTQHNETSGNWVTELVQSLEELTGQQDLLHLSLLKWASKIFAFSLLRPYQAWCPLCYQQWYDDNRVIYIPLLWLLTASDVCIRHPHQELQEQCPHCQLRFLGLSKQSCPGYCSKCHQWLGSSVQPLSAGEQRLNQRQLVEDDLFDYGLHLQYWWLDDSEQVVANTPDLFLPPEQGSPPIPNYSSLVLQP